VSQTWAWQLTEMVETYQVRDSVLYRDGAERCAAMGPVRVTRDVLELQTRIKLYGPLHRLEIMRRDRELGKWEASPCAPEDDAATMLRRPVHPSLQHAEAHLIPGHTRLRPRLRRLHAEGREGKTETDVPERGECAKDIFHDTVNDCVSFLGPCLVDSEFVI